MSYGYSCEEEYDYYMQCEGEAEAEYQAECEQQEHFMLVDAYKRAVEHYGKDRQVEKAIEELDELKLELMCKGDAFSRDNIISEMADVLNMLNQLFIIYEIDELKILQIAKEKMQRTMQRIEADNG